MEAFKIPEKPIRKITLRAFWQRVSDVKYAYLIELSKTNSLLAARLSIINGAEYVDLDDEGLVSSFHELASLEYEESTLFTKEDETRIFSDGLNSEKPSNIK